MDRNKIGYSGEVSLFLFDSIKKPKLRENCISTPLQGLGILKYPDSTTLVSELMNRTVKEQEVQKLH
jgi:hypothetical protein